MTDNSELIERTLNISQACLLPKLLEDFDSKPLSGSDFEKYKIMANENIYLLMDILYQNRELLTEKIYDNQLLQIRVNLLLITCEQIEPNPYFHSDDKILLDSVWKITADHLEIFEDKIYQNVIQIYKDSLRKNEWKKNFGHIHGFALFCKIILTQKSSLVSDDLLMFILSVGSNLVEHYEPHLKTIGLKVYMQLLKYGNATKLKELNIHQVIYSETFPLIQRCNEMDYNKYLYESLFIIIAVENYAKVSSSKWCKYDEVMSKLLIHFGFENDSKVSRLLVYQIAKFCSISYDQVNLKSFEELDIKDLKYFEALKSQISPPNHRATRWINSIMETMTRESVRLLNNTDDAEYFLYIFNSIYILSIGTMEPSDFEQILENFTKKLILILMKVVKSFKQNANVTNSVMCILTTIEKHQSKNENLLDILQKLKQHEMLKV